MPPLGLGRDEEVTDITLQAYIVDYYNAKTVVNYTIALMQRASEEVTPVAVNASDYAELGLTAESFAYHLNSSGNGTLESLGAGDGDEHQPCPFV